MARFLTSGSDEKQLWQYDVEELNALRLKKKIKKYRDGYEVEGYFGYVSTRKEAKALVEMLKELEKNNPDGHNYLPKNRRKPDVEDNNQCNSTTS